MSDDDDREIPKPYHCFWCGEPARQVAHYDYFSAYFCDDDAHQLNFQLDMAMRIPKNANLAPVRKAIEKRLTGKKHKHTLSLMSAAHSEPFKNDGWVSGGTESDTEIVVRTLEISGADIKDDAILLERKIHIKNGLTERYARTDIEFGDQPADQLPLSEVLNEEDNRGVEIFVPATKMRLSLAVKDGGVYASIGTYLNDRDSGDTIWLWSHNSKKSDVVLTFKRRDKCVYSKTDKTWSCNYFMTRVQVFTPLRAK